MTPQAYSPWLSAPGAWEVRLRREGPGCSPGRVHDKRPSQRKAFCVRFGSIAWRGSVVWVRRLAAWPSGHRTSVTLAPPGARKRSGKNLVFPREPGAASPTDLQVISALRRNNTPRAAKETGPGNQVPIGPVFLLAFAAAKALALEMFRNYKLMIANRNKIQYNYK